MILNELFVYTESFKREVEEYAKKRKYYFVEGEAEYGEFCRR